MIALPATVRRTLDLALALEGATQRPGDFFPSRIGFEAARESPDFIRWLDRRLGQGYEAHPAQTVEVPKWGGATRPAIDLSVADRVVYDAIVSSLRTSIGPGLVNESPLPADRTAVEALLIDGEHRYVLVTDIASFYEYVRHEILISELLDLSGDEHLVGSLESLLGSTMQRAMGLPQGPPSSGYLADVYASIADRHLARSGLEIVRISDDYRIPTDSWRGAARVQLRLEQALRSIGLVINPAKTFTPSRETYAQWVPQQWVNHPVDADAEASEAHEDSLDDDEFPVPYEAWGWGPTAAAELEPVDPALVEAFVGLLREPHYWGDSINAQQSYRLVRLLRPVSEMDTEALPDHLPVLLERYPHLTKEVAISLRRRLGTTGEDAVHRAVAAVIQEHGFLFDWQLGYLLHVLIPAQERLPAPLIDAAREELFRVGAPWFVRGRAALVLATERAIEVDQHFIEMYEAAPTATKPDLLGAVSTAPEGRTKADFLRSERRDPILSKVPEVMAKNERYRW